MNDERGQASDPVNARGGDAVCWNWRFSPVFTAVFTLVTTSPQRGSHTEQHALKKPKRCSTRVASYAGNLPLALITHDAAVSHRLIMESHPAGFSERCLTQLLFLREETGGPRNSEKQSRTRSHVHGATAILKRDAHPEAL